jgi:hopanoid biosynthesis associated RND transporter like protein HpnN
MQRDGERGGRVARGMPESLEARIGPFLSRWVGAVASHPWPVLTAFALATVASLLLAADRLAVRGDTESLFAADLPFRQAERRYQEAFPMFYENLLVLVDAPTPERAAEAASRLAEALRAEPGTFHRAFVPGGGDFFEEHAFLYLSTDELEDLADRLADAQPYLSELSRDGSLSNFVSLMARGVRAVREGDVPAERLATSLAGLDAALRAEEAGEPYHLSWAEVLAARPIDADARSRFLLVQPVLDYGDIQPAKRAIVRIREVAAELGLEPGSGYRVRITGDAALSYDEMEVLRLQAGLAGLASFALVAAILFLALRSARLILATLLTLLVGLVLTAGFTTLAIGHLNLISVCFAVLFIGLGVDFGIHLCIRYRELLSWGRAHAEALRETARDVGSSILLCATTTALGFLAFVPTPFVGVAELGLISGAGMFISLFCTLTLLPALLSLPPPLRVRSEAPRTRSGARLSALPLRHPRLVRSAALVLGAAAVLLLPQARFDNNPLRVRDPSSESVRALGELLERGASSPWSLNTVAPDLESAQALAARLRQLDVVGRVVTVADLIPDHQEEKLGILEDVALFVPRDPGGQGSPPRRPGARETLASLGVLARELRSLRAVDSPPELAETARSLEDSLARARQRFEASADPGPALARVEDGVLGSLPAQLRLLAAALSAGHVTLEKLPDALLERMITEDGRVRVQIFPRADLNHHAALAAFVDGVREVAPDVAGSASEIVESGRAVVRALRQALLTAVVAIALFLLVLWRSVNDTALVLVPLGLAAILTVAASVLLDIPFNFADVIVLPLLLGMGVDSGIHLVTRARSGWRGRENLLATSTARAVAYSALTTVASFGTLGFATHLGLATLGQLLALGVGFTILCNLVLLPALIALHAPRAARTPERLATRARSS